MPNIHQDTAVRAALALLDDPTCGGADDPLNRLGEIAPSLSGLAVSSRRVEVTVRSVDLVAVRIQTLARTRGGREVPWAETHVLQLDDGRVTRIWPEFPAARIASLRDGRPLRWPAPRALPSTRAGAALIRGVARTGRRSAVASKPTEVVARFIQEFKNESRFAVFPRLFSAEFRHHFDFPGRSDGFESFMSVGRDLLTAFSDVHVEIEALFGQDDLVVERNRVTARHRRTFADVQPTGRPVAWTEIHLYRVKDGRIIENWPGVDVERLVEGLA